MKLGQLIKNLENGLFSNDPEITGIHFHSEKIEPGNIFVAIRGFEEDGHAYINSAIKSGAVAVIGEKDIHSLPVPYYKVECSRLILAKITSLYYHLPSNRHTVIGITGTNGKTTTTYLLRHILEYAGLSCSLFGTIKNIVNGFEVRSNHTTPDALQIQQWLYESNDPVVIMEVSSQGLDQHRVSGVAFDYGVFTNLSHEHLEYHKSLEDYFEVKSQFFRLLKEDGEGIINSECSWSNRLTEILQASRTSFYTYGKRDCDDLSLISIENIEQPIFKVAVQGTIYEIRLQLPGSHNISNALAAFLTAHRMGIDGGTIVEALHSFSGVTGKI